MSSGRIARHRNYGELMARHERDLKIRRIARVFVYFLIIVVFILIFFLVRRLEQGSGGKTTVTPTAYHQEQNWRA